MANSKMVYAKRALPVPHPSGEPLVIHTSTGGLQHWQVVLFQSPMGSMLLSSGSWCAQNFVCVLQDWSLCFSQSSGRPIIKPHWPPKPDSLGIPSPFVTSPGWKAWHGVQNIHNSVRTSLGLLFSCLRVNHLTGMGFDLIMIVPLLPPCWSFFVFGCGVSFFVWVPVFSCQWLFNS